jgi:hypothetical protein
MVAHYNLHKSISRNSAQIKSRPIKDHIVSEALEEFPKTKPLNQYLPHILMSRSSSLFKEFSSSKKTR